MFLSLKSLETIRNYMNVLIEINYFKQLEVLRCFKHKKIESNLKFYNAFIAKIIRNNEMIKHYKQRQNLNFNFHKITNIYTLICNDLYLFTLIFIEMN